MYQERTFTAVLGQLKYRKNETANLKILPLAKAVAVRQTNADRYEFQVVFEGLSKKLTSHDTFSFRAPTRADYNMWLAALEAHRNYAKSMGTDASNYAPPAASPKAPPLLVGPASAPPVSNTDRAGGVLGGHFI
jgi:hypothetical protein